MRAFLLGVVAVVLVNILIAAFQAVRGQTGVARPLGNANWVDLAPLREPRQEVAVAALNGRIYAVAGFRRDTSSADTVEAYDPASDSWETVAPLPLAVNHAGAAAVNGKLYVIGGHPPDAEAADTTFAYDPETNTWSRMAPMPTARGSLAIAVVDGKIYAVGGWPQARERDFAVYDPANDTWNELAPMPSPRNHLAAAGVAGKVYVAGGRSGESARLSNALEEYDPSTGEWARKTPLPTARGGIAGAEANGRLYVFGGEGNRMNPLGMFDEVEAYDPATDTWQRLDPMAVPRHGIGAATLDGRIYIPGGATVEGFGVTPIHQALQL